MQLNDLFEAPITISTEDLPELKFSSPKEALDWIQSERKFYTEIFSDTGKPDAPLTKGLEQINSVFVQAIKQIQGLSNNSATEEQYKRALDSFVNNYKSGKIVDSHSVLAESIKSLKATDPPLAPRVLLILLRTPFEFNDSTNAGMWFRAAGIAESLSRGWIDLEPPLSASLTALRKGWDDVFSRLENELQERNARLDEYIQVIRSQKDDWQSQLQKFASAGTDLSSDLGEKVKSAIEAGATQIEDFKSAYNQALALRAPTQYWRDKQVGHRWAAAAWFVAFAVAAAVAVLGVWFVWHITIESHLKEGESPSYTAFLPSIGAALLTAWFMRMFSRQVISNLALSADSGERVAMVKTYLALTEGGHAQESDRGLILSSLFRSAAKTSDDSAPPTVADVLNRILRGDKP